MASLIQKNFRARKTFAKLKQVIEIPNLIDIQKRATTSSSRSTSRRTSARTSACRASSRASSRSRTSRRPARSSSCRYNLEKPKYDVDECRAARHDVRRADQGRHPPRRVGRQRRDRRPVDPRRQGAGSLLRRDPADDRLRHVHHQRHRARHRLAAAPLARRVLRPRQGQDALVAASCSTRPA